MEHIGDFKVGELIQVEATLRLSEVHLVVELAHHDLVILIRLEPLDALAFLPEAELCGLARNDVSTETVLLTAAPVTAVSASV